MAYRYEIIKYLGSGSYGVVVRAFDHKTDRLVAIKFMVNENDWSVKIKCWIEFFTHITCCLGGMEAFWGRWGWCCWLKTKRQIKIISHESWIILCFETISVWSWNCWGNYPSLNAKYRLSIFYYHFKASLCIDTIAMTFLFMIWSCYSDMHLIFYMPWRI